MPSVAWKDFLYSLEQKKSFQATDGMSDARYPVFDRGGKYLYFAASTDMGQANSWLEMSSINRPFTRSAYMIVLDKTQASPLAPESDDEKVAAEAAATPTPAPDSSQQPPTPDAGGQAAAKPGGRQKPVVVRVD